MRAEKNLNDARKIMLKRKFVKSDNKNKIYSKSY